MSDPVDEISRELRGKREQRPETPRPKRERKRTYGPGYAKSEGLPVASERSSVVAQRWMDLAEEAGFNPPFNANWLAHQISARTVKDDRLKKMLKVGRHNDVQRWLIKMAEKFWDEYVDDSIRNKDLSGFFLDEAWEDVRDYAFICLRAAYLKEHGVAKPPVEANPWYETQIHKQLKEAKLKAWLEEYRNSEFEESKISAGQSREERVRSIRRKLEGIRAKRLAKEQEDE